MVGRGRRRRSPGDPGGMEAMHDDRDAMIAPSSAVANARSAASTRRLRGGDRRYRKMWIGGVGRSGSRYWKMWTAVSEDADRPIGKCGSAVSKDADRRIGRCGSTYRKMGS